MLTAAQVAPMLGMSVEEVRKLVKKNRITHYKLGVGGRAWE